MLSKQRSVVLYLESDKFYQIIRKCQADYVSAALCLAWLAGLTCLAWLACLARVVCFTCLARRFQRTSRTR